MSRNVPTIRLASLVGEKNVARLARDAGIDADLRESPMIALGIAEVSPIELTSAYTAFSGAGRAVEPRFVTLVENAAGDALWQPEVRSHDVLDPGVAYLMTDLMRDAVDRGTGRSVRSAGYRGVASGKTGTTNEGADAWFVGYTPRITAGIWVGFDRPREIAPRANGGSVAAYAWGRMLRRVESWAGGNPWEQPSRVVRVALDPETRLALEDGCVPRRGEPTTEFFLRGTTPDAVCPEHAGDNRSLLGRIGSFIGGLFGGDDQREVRIETERRTDTDAETRRRRPEYRITPPGSERAERPRPRRNERRSDEEWADDLLESVERELEVTRERQREAVEALRDLRELVGERLDRESRDAIERILDGAIRSVEREAREQSRSQERRVEAWVEDRLRELRRNGDMDERTRERIEQEIRHALGSWM
jgi:membrane peptidoglycan carboxypeptidase